MLRRTVLCFSMMFLGTNLVLADRMSACRKNASPDEQSRACSDVIDQKPDTDVLANAWAHRAEAYARKGMASAAADNFTRAIETKPDLKFAWMGRGMAHLVARRFDDAIADYSMVIKLDPRDTQAYVARGYAYLVKNKPKRAVQDFSKGLQIHPTNVSALNNRGLAYRKLGQHKRSIADYTAAIQINPRYALAYNNRGYAYETLGQKANAVDDFRNALAIDSSLIGARDGLVRLSAASTIAAHSTKLASKGAAIAKKNCAVCHAIGQRGDSPVKGAPRFRDIHARHPILALRQPISRAIATPHDRMPKLPLSNTDIDLMITYINSLRSKP